jgi:hypothetical protein
MHGLITLQMSGKLGPDRPTFDVLRHEMMRLIVRGASAAPNKEAASAAPNKAKAV